MASEKNSLTVFLYEKTHRKNVIILVFQAFVIALTPTLVFYAIGARSIEPINGQDGYAYIGVVARTQDFLSRFPDSYFGTRFGYIIPSDLFRWIFGFEVGHHLLRFGLLALVASMLRLRGSINFSSGVVSVVLFSASPIVLVSTFSTYTMSIGALSLLIGILIFVFYDTEGSGQFVAPLLSSAMLAVAWNAHLQLLLPSMIVFGVLTLERIVSIHAKRTLPLIKYCLAGLLGSLLTCLVGVLILGVRYGVWNPWAPAFKFLSSESDSLFESRGYEWFTWRHYVLLIPISISVGYFVWKTEENPFLKRSIRRLTIATISLVVTYAYYQWIQKNIAFETFFHSSGLFVVSTCLLVTSIGVFLNRFKNKVFIVATLTVLITMTMYFIGGNAGGNFYVLSTLTGLLCAALFIAYRFKTRIQMAFLLCMIAMSSWVVVSSPHDFPPTTGGYRTDPLYDQALFSYDKGSMNRASVVDQISQILPSARQYGGQIKVWFDPLSPYDQLSAPFLWYRSALQSPTDPPLPTITPTVLQNIQSHTARFIVIIGQQRTQVDDAAKEIENLARYSTKWVKEIRTGNFVAFVALLENESCDNVCIESNS